MPYEDNKSEARELLYQLEKIDTNNILFAEDFICADFPRKISCAVLTDKCMYVIYNLQKIIFKLELKNVINTSVHYINDKFVLAFKLNNNKTKGFSIRNEYSTVATGLQDILYHMFNKSQIMYSSDGRLGPNLTYNYSLVDELIEKSSYGNTLIGEQSVYSEKTIFSKITSQNKNNKVIHNKINSYGLESESVKKLNPTSSNTEDYVSLKVK